MKKTQFVLYFITNILLFVVSDQCFSAAPLQQGDIVVIQQSGGSVYKVNPTSGAVSLITSGGKLSSPSHVLIDDLGNIFTAERHGTASSPSGIIKIDPATGQQQLIASGSYLTTPFVLDFDLNHNLIVGDFTNDNLVRIDPATGVQTLLATFSDVTFQDVDVDNTGKIVVLDYTGKIIKYDPLTSTRSTISSGGLFNNPADLVILPSGNYLVSNYISNFTSQLIEVNSVTGAQNLVTDLKAFGWISLDSNSNLVYADFYKTISVERINLSTLQVQNITKHPFSSGATVGVGVYTVPEPSTIAVFIFGACVVLTWGCRRRLNYSHVRA